MQSAPLSRAVAAEFRDGPERPRWISPPSATWALGDPEGVARIVRLLADNGLRHAPPPATVEVRVEAVDGHALVRVLDGGNGVPESGREAIFERFQRGAHVTAPGFGLGLAIGAELARRIAGELIPEAGRARRRRAGGRALRACAARRAHAVALPPWTACRLDRGS
jgi:signal transduction histidine kinase